ncbi:MAG: hypothetical protein K9M99_03625 [Candidatus Cloacimonetes bacterium]|nr:hypothetical protein [Candidatus Cloacimonadota bacterium]
MINKTFRFSTESLLPDISLILIEMGYSIPLADHYLSDLINDTLQQVRKHTRVQAGFIMLPKDSIKTQSNILFENRLLFEPGSIIMSQLQNVTSLAVFLATLGSDFDLWIKFVQQIDMLQAFVIDTIGSLMVEKAVDLLEEQISMQAMIRAEKCTNRFSPGYCQWLVDEQHQLFHLLPADFDWVKLQPSCLMTPLKSISGIIGLGKNVIKIPYHCAFCDNKSCYRRLKNRKGQ